MSGAVPVVLNVGGTKFSTTEATLRSRPSGEDYLFNTLDYSKGEVFIDRDPTLFKYILNYLRDGRVMFADDPLTAALLFQEAKFYGLGHLVEQISLVCKNSTGYHDIKAPRK
uniref:BTB domain-containing protein n=1 Tax=Haemonchus contortus TaxID=6289 RepID=A0A7I5E6L4_HAECO